MADFYLYDRYHCDDAEIYANEKLVNKLNELFSHPVVRQEKTYEQSNNANTTMGLAGLYTVNLKEADRLVAWVRDKIMQSSVKFMGRPARDIKFGRNWANIGYRGSEMSCHMHTDDPTFHVAIFYQCVPPGGSDLILINPEAVVEHQAALEFDEQDRQHLNVRTGDLIIHHGSAWHAVTPHNSDTPRIVMPFDFNYIMD